MNIISNFLNSPVTNFELLCVAISLIVVAWFSLSCQLRAIKAMVAAPAEEAAAEAEAREAWLRDQHDKLYEAQR